MNELDVLKAVPPEVVKEAYSDVASGPLKELGKFGVDLLKTARLVLFPFQYGAAVQDRLERRLAESVERVPAERRILPVESLALPIAERLRFYEDESIVADMYVSLLARAMDRERAGEAHPAFVQIVSQLAPDEALLIEQISTAHPSAFLRPAKKDNAVFLGKERSAEIHSSDLSDIQKQRLESIAVRPEELAQPHLVYTYIEHLVSLGIVSYFNEPRNSEFKGAKTDFGFWFIGLNGMGTLFYRACLSDRSRSVLN